MSPVGVFPRPPNFNPPAAVTSSRERRGCALRVPAGGGFGGTGRRAPALGGEGQAASGTGGWVFPCQKWTFCLPSGAGWRAGGCRSPRSCYTPSFVCAWSEILWCCRRLPRRSGSRLGPARRGLPRGCAPRAPPTRRVAPLPLFSQEPGIP